MQPCCSPDNPPYTFDSPLNRATPLPGYRGMMRVARNLAPHFLLLTCKIFFCLFPQMSTLSSGAAAQGGYPAAAAAAPLLRVCVGTASSLATDEDRKQSHVLVRVASNLIPDAGRKQPHIPSYFCGFGFCDAGRKQPHTRCGSQATSHPYSMPGDLPARCVALEHWHRSEMNHPAASTHS